MLSAFFKNASLIKSSAQNCLASLESLGYFKNVQILVLLVLKHCQIQSNAHSSEKIRITKGNIFYVIQIINW